MNSIGFLSYKYYLVRNNLSILEKPLHSVSKKFHIRKHRKKIIFLQNLFSLQKKDLADANRFNKLPVNLFSICQS